MSPATRTTTAVRTNLIPSSSHPGYYESQKLPDPSISSASYTEASVLTTVFTPPAACASRLYSQYASRNGTQLATRNALIDAECYPPAYIGDLTGVIEIYSPGVCPKSWQPAASAVRSGATTVACCPNGLEYIQSKWCGSLLPSGTIIAEGTNVNVSIAGPVVVLDYHILVAWASSDLAAFTPTAAPLSALANVTANSTLPPLKTAEPHHTFRVPSQSVSQSHFVPNSQALTPGAIAGISIACVVIALILTMGTGGFFLWRRERRKRIAAETTVHNMVLEAEEKVNVGKDGYPEIDGVPLVELDHKHSMSPPSVHLTEVAPSFRSESLSSRPSSPIQERDHEH